MQFTCSYLANMTLLSLMMIVSCQKKRISPSVWFVFGVLRLDGPIKKSSSTLKTRINEINFHYCIWQPGC